MKGLLTSIGALGLFFFGSGFFFADPSQEVSSLIAEPLTDDVSEQLKGIEYTHDGTTISVGDTELVVLPYIENSGVKDGEHILGIRFEIQVNGKKDERLTFGVVERKFATKMASSMLTQPFWSASPRLKRGQAP